MQYYTNYKLENFILDTQWDDLPQRVQDRMKGCMIDLMGALIVGSKSDQFKVGLRLAKKVFGEGEIPVVGNEQKFNYLGAAVAMGHSSNAYDIDDGHNIIRAHPGTSIIGAVLSAAMEKNIRKEEFLEALLVGYETTVRSGIAIMDYYSNPHSSGTFAPPGIAASVGKLFEFTKEELNNCISIAEFNAPLVAAGRSVEYPSMNKDGVPFGIMIGMLAIEEALCGFKGNKNLLESDKYSYLLDDLGEVYQVMSLYFKPYPCCRWAHPAIDACISLMDENAIATEDIEQVIIQTFKSATNLSKIVPHTADEAQYNIAYPVAAALVYKDFGFEEVHEDSIPDELVVNMMQRLSFEEDPKLTDKFPEHRICRAIIETKDGKIYSSKECEPRGEASENIDIEWLINKFKRITSPVFTDAGQDVVIKKILEEDCYVLDLIDIINNKNFWK